MQINTMGLVLRAVRVGEADQILTVLTPGNGVLSASARGSLRLKNKLFSACGLFCYSEFAITLGRKTNFIDSAAVSKVFHGLSKTVEGTALAAYLSELTITLAPEPPESTYNGWACIRYGIGETLVHYTDSMELEPWLAKSWENDGNLTWTITLQDNVTFSNGRAMDAAAVKQCLEHLLENHDRAPGDTKIADMQADGQILTITTSEPNPALMNYLGDPYGCIIDVDASDFDVGIVAGTGPYVVTDMVTDDHLTLTKNENYWNGTPKIDELTIRTLSNGDIVDVNCRSKS